jgi:hypothetical protein
MCGHDLRGPIQPELLGSISAREVLFTIARRRSRSTAWTSGFIWARSPRAKATVEFRRSRADNPWSSCTGITGCRGRRPDVVKAPIVRILGPAVPPTLGRRASRPGPDSTQTAAATRPYIISARRNRCGIASCDAISARDYG